MNCEKDAKCLEISKEYKAAIEPVSNAFKKIRESIDNASSNFNDFDIPNDYLGSKVKESLQKMQDDSFTKCSEEIRDIGSNAIKSLEQLQQEHLNHYNNWYETNKLKKEKNGNTTSYIN